MPSVIKGDLDSIRPEVLRYYKDHGVPVIDSSADQDTTDLTKCIAFVEKQLKVRVHTGVCVCVNGVVWCLVCALVCVCMWCVYVSMVVWCVVSGVRAGVCYMSMVWCGVWCARWCTYVVCSCSVVLVSFISLLSTKSHIPNC
jgi:thiamine pyrophosphokinase